MKIICIMKKLFKKSIIRGITNIYSLEPNMLNKPQHQVSGRTENRVRFASI